MKWLYRTCYVFVLVGYAIAFYTGLTVGSFVIPAVSVLGALSILYFWHRDEREDHW